MTEKTALRAINERDNDMLAARRFADVMLSMLRDFIPENSRRDAWERMVATSLDQGFDLTTTAMRKEYEAWKGTQLEGLHIGAERLRERLDLIADIAEGSGTANSLPHIAKIARGADEQSPTRSEKPAEK